MPYAEPEEEFEVGGHSYRARKMSAMDQLHCSRRVSPLLTAFGKSIEDGVASDNPFESLGPITEFVSRLPDEQVDYVVSKCLSHVSRKPCTSITARHITSQSTRTAMRSRW